MIIPPYLQHGDTIGIVCPAGYMPAKNAEACINTLHQCGFKTITGITLGHQHNYFSGTDQERLHDLQQMLDNEKIKAILCGRGGYGLSRIIDELDFTKFKLHPKWIIGYSDITLLHGHLNHKVNTASLHSPMAAAFNDGEQNNKYVNSLLDALTGRKSVYQCAFDSLNRIGTTTGTITGGNLSLLAHMTGTASDINTDGCILFIEDIGEYLYNVDRMMLQLKRAGKLDNLKALIVGAFTEMKDTTIPFGQTVEEIIFDKVKEYAYPVCFNFPVGHQRENYALKTGGVNYSLDINSDSTILTEV